MSEDKNQPIKIQYRGVYIQLPPNDLEALDFAKKAIRFMIKYLKEKIKRDEDKHAKH